GRFEREQRGEMRHHVPPRRERALEHALELLALDDLERIDVALLELLGELGVRDVHRLRPPAGGELHEGDGPRDQERPERQRPECAGPAELARRRDAVGHQVRLAMYGRWRKFSASSNAYRTRNTREALNTTKTGSVP